MTIRLKSKEKLEILSNMSTMLKAGITLIEAVDSLLEDSSGAQKKALQLMRAELNEGHPLSNSLAKMSQSFDPVTINLVKAGEESGTLETTLEDIIKNTRKEMAFNDKLKSSMIYPLFVIGVMVGVLAMILLFVVPRIGKVFLGLNMDLPLVTTILIEVSSILTNYFIFILLGTVALIVLISVLFKTHRRALVSALLGMPGLRKLGRQIDLSRFTRSMGLLLSSGIPVVEALELSRASVVRPEISAMVEHMARNVNAGKPMSDGLKQHGKIIPPVMSRLMQTAEESGALENTMQELSTYFTTQVNRTLKTVTSLLEPALLVFVGLMVGGIMLAIIAPIYGLIGQINK